MERKRIVSVAELLGHFTILVKKAPHFEYRELIFCLYSLQEKNLEHNE